MKKGGGLLVCKWTLVGWILYPLPETEYRSLRLQLGGWREQGERTAKTAGRGQGRGPGFPGRFGEPG